MRLKTLIKKTSAILLSSALSLSHFSNHNNQCLLIDTNYDSASADFDLTIQNNSTVSVDNMAAQVALYDNNEKLVTTSDAPINTIASDEKQTSTVTITIKQPKLWDCDNPNLYTAVISLYDKKTFFLEPALFPPFHFFCLSHFSGFL